MEEIRASDAALSNVYSIRYNCSDKMLTLTYYNLY